MGSVEGQEGPSAKSIKKKEVDITEKRRRLKLTKQLKIILYCVLKIVQSGLKNKFKEEQLLVMSPAASFLAITLHLCVFHICMTPLLLRMVHRI